MLRPRVCSQSQEQRVSGEGQDRGSAWSPWRGATGGKRVGKPLEVGAGRLERAEQSLVGDSCPGGGTHLSQVGPAFSHGGGQSPRLLLPGGRSSAPSVMAVWGGTPGSSTAVGTALRAHRNLCSLAAGRCCGVGRRSSRCNVAHPSAWCTPCPSRPLLQSGSRRRNSPELKEPQAEHRVLPRGPVGQPGGAQVLACSSGLFWSAPLPWS